MAGTHDVSRKSVQHFYYIYLIFIITVNIRVESIKTKYQILQWKLNTTNQKYCNILWISKRDFDVKRRIISFYKDLLFFSRAVSRFIVTPLSTFLLFFSSCECTITVHASCCGTTASTEQIYILTFISLLCYNSFFQARTPKWFKTELIKRVCIERKSNQDERE